MCQKNPKKYIVIANQCRNTDVALSKDSLRSQSPDFSENYRQGAKAPLADQGWCSAQRIRILMIASGNHTIIHAVSCVPRKHETEGIRTSIFPGILNSRTFAIPQSWPCGRRPCQLPLHKGAGVLPHQCVYRCFSEEPESCTTFTFFAMTGCIRKRPE